MSKEVDTFNRFLVGVRGDKIIIMNPPGPMTPDEALLLAAYLVGLSMKSLEDFKSVYDAICNA